MANLSHLSRVLVLEDEALIALDIEVTLSDAGVGEIVAAMAGEEALSSIDTQQIDAAVLDLHLGRGGWSYDVARRLREKGIPFIFSSGRIDVAEGFNEIPLVMKPFSAEQLVATLLQVTAAHQTARAE
jgi:DNA-binding response OmpR family regulator